MYMSGMAVPHNSSLIVSSLNKTVTITAAMDRVGTSPATGPSSTLNYHGPIVNLELPRGLTEALPFVNSVNITGADS
jgi:hypothetical protein